MVATTTNPSCAVSIKGHRVVGGEPNPLSFCRVTVALTLHTGVPFLSRETCVFGIKAVVARKRLSNRGKRGPTSRHEAFCAGRTGVVHFPQMHILAANYTARCPTRYAVKD